MATEKILSTRIQLKVDTLENWSSSSLILKKGEVAFATAAAAAGSGLTEPVVMIKIGDGDHTFSGLPYNFYAKASDVLEAAKSETKLKAFVNQVIADAGIASNEALNTLTTRVKNTEDALTVLNGDAETAGSIAKAIADAIAGVNVADTAVTGQYVSEVSQVGGKVSVKREALPTYTLTSGSANGTVAFNGADIAVKGLGSAAYADAKSFDASGAADAVDQKLTEYKTSNDAAVAAADLKAQKGVDDAAAALAKANEKTTMAEVEAKNYATKTEAQGYANAKDTAIAAAKKAGDDAAAALIEYKDEVAGALAGKVDSGTYNTDKAALEASIKKNADAIKLLDEGLDQEKIDGVKDLIDYVDEHQADFAGVLEDVEAAQKDIAANSLAITTEAERATAKEAELATAITDALAAAKKDSADKDAVVLSEAQAYADQAEADALSAAKTYAETKAAEAQAAAQTYAEGKFASKEQGAKADTAIQPDALATTLEGYYTKAAADAAFMDSTETGNAIDAKITALNLAATYEPIGAESRAKAYADGLAGNYATAAQGTKADSALQTIEAGTGLKVTAKANNKQTVDIDETVVFVFNCGGASEE